MSTQLPNFSSLNANSTVQDLAQLLDNNRQQLNILLNQNPKHWHTLIPVLEEMDDKLSKLWSPIAHLHAVKQTPAWRDAYNACLPKLTAYSTEISQNEQLYQAYAAIANSADYAIFNQTQQKLIQNELRDFRLSGVALPLVQKQRYAKIQERLAELTTKFQENILDAAEHWFLHITDQTELAGIPEHVVTAAAAKAHAKNLSGWILTLDYPSYAPTMSYAKNRALREKMYTAYSTRASDQGPHDKKFNNSEIMLEILMLKHELSQLLGFHNYAELSLATKMAKQPQEVLNFLNQLVEHARPKALQELEQLKTYAKQKDNLDEIKAWDIAYYSEHLQHARYGINDKILRPYFPATRVLEGLFLLTKRLFGMRVVEKQDIDTWHPDVKFFQLFDEQDKLRGQFYLDLYARPQKREGAWMDDYCSRRHLADGEIQIPTAYLTCNLTLPQDDKPALLTHDEVLTIFHEYGHGLHHMLTQVDYAAISGINGVAWDAVELPSQFMECFAWEKDVLDFISGHYETGQPLPENLLNQLRAAKNFQSGLHLVRQLEFAIFDFRLHLEFEPKQGYEQIQTILNDVRAQVAVTPIPTFNRFQHSFSHIFAGGYAAGYYSYLWAEMLSADAYSKFLERGIFDITTGRDFLHYILEQGGSKDAAELFRDFRGRNPDVKALLYQYGIYD